MSSDARVDDAAALAWFANLEAGLKKGAEDIANDLLTNANATVPLDTGELTRSGAVLVSGDHAAAAVYYDTKYALRQHEDLTYQHAPGRRARWLALTAEEQEPRYRQYLQTILRAVGARP